MQIGFLNSGSQVWNRFQLQGVARAARQHPDLRLLLLPDAADIDRLISDEMKGFIGSVPPTMLTPLHEKGILTVNFTRHSGLPTGGEVWSDYDRLANMAVSHLAERGCTRIACFGTQDQRQRNAIDMQEALWRAVATSNLDPLGDFSPPGPPHPWTLHGQIQEVAEWLRSLPLPLGLVTTDATHAGRALEAIRTAGLRIPGDVGLMSLSNDTTYLECCTPTVSHMHLNQVEKGERAVELILEMLQGKQDRNVRIQQSPNGVIPLKSTAYASPSDPGLQDALDLLQGWEFDLPSVEDLAKAAGMSRSTLFRRMQATLGKKPGDLLYQSRREKALKLLRNEDVTLAEVADRCSYGLPSQLTHDIKRHTGLSPKNYREQWRGKS